MIFLGYLATIFLAIALGIMMLIWSPDPTRTLSQNAARHKLSMIYYGVTFVFFFIIFTPFFWISFQQDIFHKIYLVGAVSQLVAVCVPELPGIRTKIHQLFAGVMSFAALALVILIQTTPLAVLVALYMLTCWVLYLRKNKLLQRHALLAQIIYFAGFLAVLLSIAASYKT